MVNAFPYWIEHQGEAVTNRIWTKISIPANCSITLYIMKKDGYQPNGDSVFEFFNDFENLDKWTILNGGGSGTAFVTTFNNESVVKLQPADVNNRVAIVAPYNSIRNDVLTVCFTTDTDVYDGILIAYSDNTIWSAARDEPQNGYGFSVGRNSNTTTAIHVYTNGTAQIISQTINLSLSSNTYYVAEFVWNDNDLVGYLNRDKITSAIDTTFSSFDYIHISCAINPWYVDWIFVRKYADQEPTVSTEQLDANTLKVTIYNPNNYDLVGYQVCIPTPNGFLQTSTDSLLVTDQNPNSYWIDSNLNMWIYVELKPGETKTLYIAPDPRKLPNPSLFSVIKDTAVQNFVVDGEFDADFEKVVLRSGTISTNFVCDNKVVEVEFEVDPEVSSHDVIKLGNSIAVKRNANNLDVYLDYDTAPDSVTVSIPITTGWKYSREITISNPNSVDLTDFQVKIELTSNNFDFSKASPTGDDIRFYDENGNKIPYWIEKWDSSNAQAIVWIKVPSIPANGETKVTMMYGNESAVSESNGDDVFEFFIDYGTSGQLYSENQEVCQIPSDDGIIGIYARPGNTGKGLLIYRKHTTTIQLLYLAMNVNIAGYSLGLDTVDVINGTMTFIHISDDQNFPRLIELIPNINKIIDVENNAYYTVNSPPNYDLFSQGSLFVPSVSTYDVDIVVYWIFVRKYADQEPTVAVGQEQLNATGKLKLVFDFTNGTRIVVNDTEYFSDTTRSYSGLDTIEIGDPSVSSNIVLYNIKVYDPAKGYSVIELERNF